MKIRLTISLLLLSAVAFAADGLLQAGTYDGDPNTPITAGFSVEKLSRKEFAALDKARKALDAEQERFRQTETRIKEAHGQEPKSEQAGTWLMVSNGVFVCGDRRTVVELRGEYALITSTTTNPSCDANLPSYPGTLTLHGPPTFTGTARTLDGTTSIAIKH